MKSAIMNHLPGWEFVIFRMITIKFIVISRDPVNIEHLAAWNGIARMKHPQCEICTVQSKRSLFLPSKWPKQSFVAQLANHCRFGIEFE